MAKAIWNGEVIAETDNYEEVENNIYFPPDSLNMEFFKENSKEHSTCPWKGEASYYDIVVNGKTNEGAAWYYPEPKEKAKHIKGFAAFWKGVEVTKD